VRLDWADNGESDRAGYGVYRQSADGTSPSSPLASPASSAFTGLANGTTKTYPGDRPRQRRQMWRVCFVCLGEEL
jgi:hypothetical protein